MTTRTGISSCCAGETPRREALAIPVAIALADNIQPVEVPYNQKGYLMNAIETVPVWAE
jgi:hypothetical protein